MALQVESLFCLSLPTFFGLINVVILTGSLFYFDDQEYEGFYNYSEVKSIGFEIYGYSLAILSGLLLIIGTVKKCPLLLFPWLLMSVPAVVIGMIVTIDFLVRNIRRWDKFVHTVSLHSLLVLFSGFGLILVTAVQAYMWIEVLSFIKSYKSREEKNQERRGQYNVELHYSQPESEANIADKRM